MDAIAMNAWHIAAIFLGAVTAFCAYQAGVVQSRRSSEEQSSHLSSELQKIGSQIEELRFNAVSSDKSAELKGINEKYRDVAEEFFQSIRLRKAKEGVRTAKQQAEELQRTQKVETYYRAIRSEIEKLVTAYNDSAGQKVLEIQGTEVPQNLFRSNEKYPAYILFKFQGSKFWCARINLHNRRTPSLEFVRLLSPDGSSNYQAMHVTGDSVLLILYDDQFEISLHQHISEAVKANITDGLVRKRQPLHNLVPIAAKLVRRIIEYELVPSQEDR